MVVLSNQVFDSLQIIWVFTDPIYFWVCQIIPNAIIDSLLRIRPPRLEYTHFMSKNLPIFILLYFRDFPWYCSNFNVLKPRLRYKRHNILFLLWSLLWQNFHYLDSPRRFDIVGKYFPAPISLILKSRVNRIRNQLELLKKFRVEFFSVV